MRKRHVYLLALVLMTMMAASCGSDSETGAKTETKPPPTHPAGSTMANIQAKGKFVVGTKYDQVGFGQQNPTTGKVEGFDVEIAKRIAVAIFGGDAKSVEPKIQFVETVSKNREPFIQDGKVDIVAATYTINDTRKQVVDFAGPYFVAKQDIMVKSDDSSIKGVADLNGKKACTVKGSTSEKNLRAKAPRADVSLFDTYSQCGEALRDGRVQAVTTDAPILAGLASRSDRAFKLVDAPFSEEPYGIGLKKGDDVFRNFINDRLEEIYANGEWQAAFDATLGAIGLKREPPPKVDRYSSLPATTTTTGSTGTGAGAGTTTSSTSTSTSTSTPTSTSTSTSTTQQP
ncbi:MAG: glutamate ABC transporter substrate-binding protein [Actinomycetota bacterium]|nr:glutamate ABC transporter substrate-binding protein [Actinomycetota bacterium]